MGATFFLCSTDKLVTVESLTLDGVEGFELHATDIIAHNANKEMIVFIFSKFMNYQKAELDLSHKQILY